MNVYATFNQEELYTISLLKHYSGPVHLETYQEGQRISLVRKIKARTTVLLTFG
jgi:hypothetical protein